MSRDLYVHGPRSRKPKRYRKIYIIPQEPIRPNLGTKSQCCTSNRRFRPQQCQWRRGPRAASHSRSRTSSYWKKTSDSSVTLGACYTRPVPPTRRCKLGSDHGDPKNCTHQADHGHGLRGRWNNARRMRSYTLLQQLRRAILGRKSHATL